jgi:4-hydroxy-4-methyl-2-oxoglutarate aldolase
MSDMNALLAEMEKTFEKVSTGMVVDALAISGIKCGIMGVRPIRGFEDVKIFGPAVTVLFSAPHPGNPKLNNYQIIRNSSPGSILVIDGKGLDGHFTGDNQGECAKRQGFKGIVTYGGARDLAGFRKIGLPLYCTGSSVRLGELQISAYNVPIEIGTMVVKPGDIIFGDEDGVVAIPTESIETLLKNLSIIFDVETGMEKAIQNDAPLEEIFSIISKKKANK